MGWSRQLGTVSVDEVSGVAKRACEGEAALREREAHTLAKALAMAKAGIVAHGVPEADVWVGGTEHTNDDGSKQISISATVTIKVPAPKG